MSPKTIKLCLLLFLNPSLVNNRIFLLLFCCFLLFCFCFCFVFLKVFVCFIFQDSKCITLLLYMIKMFPEKWNIRSYYFHFGKVVFLTCFNPPPSEVFFCDKSSEGGLLQPLPGFSIRNAWYPIFADTTDTKMSTIELHMTSLWLQKVCAPAEIWMHWKYT